jgi:hypothetical protein
MYFVRIFLFVLLTISSAFSQQVDNSPIEEILTVETSNGAKQSAVFSHFPTASSPTTLVAIVPGSPSLARAGVTFTGKVLIRQSGSFVVRERLRLLNDDIATLVLDCRSDYSSFCPDDYQLSEQRFKDVKPVIDLAKKNIPSINKVWLMSTSRGMFSTVGIPKYSGEYFAGIIHTASVADLILKKGVELASTSSPQFFYHHIEDPCDKTKYNTAKLVAEKMQSPLVTVYGGGGYYGDACNANTQHGFQGAEEKVMQHIVNLVRTGKVESLEIR